MRKTLLTVLAMVLMALGGTTAYGQTLSSDAVAAKWRKTPISVPNGGNTPNVMTLLKAFQRALPTKVAREVLLRGASLQDGQQYESGDDYRVLVDRRNGYCDLASECDIDQMQACVWRKKNGHRIFAVNLYEVGSASSPLLCWYDYDPKTQVLSPAKSPADDFKLSPVGGFCDWNLPMNGTDFEIKEFPPNMGLIDHVFHWDGETFTEGPARIMNVEYLYFGSEDVPQDMPAYRYYSIIDLTGNGCNVLWLSDGTGADANSAMFADNIEGMQCIADIRGGLRDSGSDYFSVTKLPPLPGSETPTLPTILLSSRDEAGGYNMSLVQGKQPVAFLFDQPDFMGGGRIVRAHNSYGDDDAIMRFYENSEGKEIRLPKPQWKPFVFVEDY